MSTEGPKAKIALPKKPLSIEHVRSRKAVMLTEEIQQSENVMELLKEVEKEHSPTQLRRGLLRDAMKVTRRMSHSLHYLVDTIRRIIDLGHARVEIFVYPGPFIDAWSTQVPGDMSIYLGLSSTALETLSQQEFLNIIGHELGHVVGGHPRIPVQLLLEHGTEILSVLDVYKLLALNRYREITADRVGLLCCQDYRVAAGCLLKSASGVTSGKLRFNLNDYLGQLEEIRSLDDVEDTSDDWFATHPFSPLRVKGLELFAQCDVYQNATRKGTKAPAIGFDEMERRLDEFMAIMNPSYLADTDEDTAGQVREWLTLAAILVALANGVLEPEEVEQISDLIGYEAFRESIDDLMEKGPNGIMDMLVERTEPVRVKSTPARRMQLIRDLTVIAIADGTIDEYEFHALFDIASLLHIGPEFVESIAEELQVEIEGNSDLATHAPPVLRPPRDGRLRGGGPHGPPDGPSREDHRHEGRGKRERRGQPRRGGPGDQGHGDPYRGGQPEPAGGRGHQPTEAVAGEI